MSSRLDPFKVEVLHFLYRGDDGAITEHFVNYRGGDGAAFSGFCFNTMEVASFRRDRVVEWLSVDDRPIEDRQTKQKTEILFTGFGEDRGPLEARAIAAGYRVRTSVTQHLAYLCCGPNAGPTKMRKAREVGAEFLTLQDFEALIADGELPLSRQN